MPPETSNGYASKVRFGFGMPTRSSSASACSVASFLLSPSVDAQRLDELVPIVNDGSRFDIGSCGMYPMRRPRMPA